MHLEFAAHSVAYLEKLKTALDSTDKSGIARFVELLESAMGTERTLFVAGNGGSAATSSHIACDLGKTILGKTPGRDTKGLRAVALNDNVPLMTAWANDASYDRIFSEQLRMLGRKGDILLVITGSGNSGNIVEAVKVAKEMGICAFGFLGFDGGKVMPMLDDHILVPSFDYGVVEDAHSVLNHLVTDWFKSEINTAARHSEELINAMATRGQ